MATTTINLTQSNFCIYIEDRDKRLSDIFWETCSGIGKRADSIRTSNGLYKYTIPTKPEINQISLSKAANVDEDKMIWAWLQEYCADQQIINGQKGNGAILMIVPLKPCMVSEAYPTKGKAFNLMPANYNFWNSDLLNVTDVSRVTLDLMATEVTID